MVVAITEAVIVLLLVGEVAIEHAGSYGFCAIVHQVRLQESPYKVFSRAPG